jgi:hypothetical protein
MSEFADESPELEHAAELRRASDLFMQRLDRLHELEIHKRELQPDKPEFVRVAREIEDLARALLFAGGQQVELAQEVHREARQGDEVVDQAIRDTPPRHDAVSVLADWRAAERRLAAAPAGSSDEKAANEEVVRLREEYRRLTAPTPEGPTN